MKKSVVSFAMMLLIFVCLSACGKKADPIVLPALEEITSIEIAGGIQDIICTEKEKIASFIQKASEAKPTAAQSTQDVPTVSKYTRLDFVYDGKLSSLFIYEKDSKWYIEQPYHGIYETDESVLSFLD